MLLFLHIHKTSENAKASLRHRVILSIRKYIAPLYLLCHLHLK